MDPSRSSRRRKRKRDDEGPPSWSKMTVVLVGPEEARFSLHTHILRKVPFFRACLEAPMIESQQGVIRLPEDYPNVFMRFSRFMYHDDFDVDLESLETYACAWRYEALHLNPAAVGLEEVFHFAKKVMAEEVQNQVLERSTKILHLDHEFWNASARRMKTADYAVWLCSGWRAAS